MRDDLERDGLEFEARLTRALETPPEITIPAGFAARVATLGRARTPAYSHAWAARSGSHRVGSLVTRGALAALIIAMLLLAPWAGHRSMAASTLEYAFAFEFVALALWMSLRPQSTR